MPDRVPESLIYLFTETYLCFYDFPHHRHAYTDRNSYFCDPITRQLLYSTPDKTFDIIRILQCTSVRAVACFVGPLDGRPTLTRSSGYIFFYFFYMRRRVRFFFLYARVPRARALYGEQRCSKQMEISYFRAVLLREYFVMSSSVVVILYDVLRLLLLLSLLYYHYNTVIIIRILLSLTLLLLLLL